MTAPDVDPGYIGRLGTICSALPEVVEEDAMTPILGPKVLPDRGLIHPEARQVVAAHPASEQEGNSPTQHSEALKDA